MSDNEELFDALRAGLTVAMIQTGRDDLVTCRSGDDANAIVSRNNRREEKYDYLPVKSDSGAIVGLFRATDGEAGPFARRNIGRLADGPALRRQSYRRRGKHLGLHRRDRC